MTPIINNSFQVVSGKFRGRKFNFPDVPSLRPTSGKIRETLFNWIQFESHNKTYLDLFTGSGSLSFEALSRGAEQVVSIEKDVNAYQSLKKNKMLLKTNKMSIFNQDALNFLSEKSTQIFDFIFLDPPFNKNYLPKTLKALSKGNFMTSNTKIYIESEFKILKNETTEWLSTNIQINKQKHTGQVHYCLITLL
ncbi:16S rRNA (guanine966-N2)-methyltransferase [Isorropodon fossajaponicum endosymbiont JTNG4]|uniref:16S rRNA (guanine(966)-N(2))-methyltransferase RsmD n=1 Tax=Isorropodon fossajaponicum symbiont TaxID=883811 RepID=UPI001914F4E3|nr:16S rRNA (guanine(966)-N(2))-methyltransferase RsmD [Isorropodon fossajaponicum symbiont]BBB24303.1 16S rRNA (guanine966-N2)-methyltransferase [Isorropodon fossajaponicum endosymbiont JTNG4]